MIHRRDFLSFGLAAATAASALQRAGDGRFNVLFVAVDDLRPELGCYGNTLIRTPKLSTGWRIGVWCSDGPTARPESAALQERRLLTGLRPDTTKVWGNRSHFPGDIARPWSHFPRRSRRPGTTQRRLERCCTETRRTRRPGASLLGLPEDDRPVCSMSMKTPSEKCAPRNRTELGGAKKSPRSNGRSATRGRHRTVPDNALQDGQVADRAAKALHRVQDRPFFLAVGFQKPHLPFYHAQEVFRTVRPEHSSRGGGLP